MRMNGLERIYQKAEAHERLNIAREADGAFYYRQRLTAMRRA